jgi:hypothetical protein
MRLVLSVVKSKFCANIWLCRQVPFLEPAVSVVFDEVLRSRKYAIDLMDACHLELDWVFLLRMDRRAGFV